MARIPDLQVDIEQRRTLAREVGELRAMSDRLAQLLTEKSRENERLRQALLAAGFEPGVIKKIAEGEV